MQTVLSNRKRSFIFLTVLISGIACSLLSTALTTALPQIMNDFKINSSMGQWLTSAYSLVMGIVTLATPFLLKRFRSRMLYVISLAIFMAGLLMCGMTHSFAVMMCGRVLQAAGNGIMIAQGQVMILTIYEKEKRGSIMGIFGLATGAAPVIAPTIAGIVVDLMGWRMIFYLVAVFVVFSMLMTIIFFENVLENERLKFDFLSLALCSAGISGLLLGAGNIGIYSLGSLMVWIPIAIGVVMTIIFVRRQLHMKHPFMELRVFKVPRFKIAVIASMILYSVVVASSILLPIYIQSVRGYSATISGIITMPGALVSALISPVSGKLYDKYGIGRIFAVGSVFLAIGNIGMIFVGSYMTMPVVMMLNIVRCLGIGCMLMPFVTWGMNSLEAKYTSHGTALITSLRTVAGAFGAAVFVAIVNLVASHSSQTTGVRSAFIGLSVFSIVEIVLALYVLKKEG